MAAAVAVLMMLHDALPLLRLLLHSSAGLMLLPLQSPTVAACSVPQAPTTPAPGLPPWPASGPPTGVGCYSDHAPQAKPPHKGKRLLQCGVPGCSGHWGCGGNAVGDTCPVEACPSWPAAVPKCEEGKITRAYCIQLCLAWKPDYAYASVAYGKECWCAVELNTCGSADDLASANICVPQSGGQCNFKCQGDTKQYCGGNFFQTVFQIREDIAAEVETGSWVLVVLVAFTCAMYMGGGAVYGARRSGSRPTLRTHPHYAKLSALHSLCVDGLAFTMIKLGLRKHTNTRQSPLLGTDERLLDLADSDSNTPASTKSAERSSREMKRAKSKSASKTSKAGASKAARAGSKSKEKSRGRRGGDSERSSGSPAALPVAGSLDDQAAWVGNEKVLNEQREGSVHSSQARIKIVI